MLGVGIIGVGLVIMIWQAIKRPAFFRGETTLARRPRQPAPPARVTGNLPPTSERRHHE